MSFKKKVGLSILAFMALMVGLIVFCGDRMVISFYGGGLVFNHSTSMREHKVSVGDTNFCVAKSYFVFSNSFHPNSSIGLVLAAELDSLEPWNGYLEGIDFHKKRKNMSRDEVDEVEAKKIGIDISYLKGNMESDGELWRKRLSGAQEENLGRYTKLSSDNPLAAMFKYYLVPLGASDYSYVIGCNSGARCEVGGHYSNSVDYKITFDEKMLGAIDDIDSSVRGLIDGFVCN